MMAQRRRALQSGKPIAAARIAPTTPRCDSIPTSLTEVWVLPRE
jgi:hypothetical protein